MSQQDLFPIPAFDDRDSLRAALRQVNEDLTHALRGLPLATFLAPQGESWSPADHLRHLIKSVRPLNAAMNMPRLVLGLRFGKSKSPSRSFEEIREVYRAALARGATAGRYTPSSRSGELDDEAWREQIFDYWGQAVAGLDEVQKGWSEKALDRYLLPHPLLGKMTVRELLYFTLYHNHHHALRVFERLESPADARA